MLCPLNFKLKSDIIDDFLMPAIIIDVTNGNANLSSLLEKIEQFNQSLSMSA